VFSQLTSGIAHLRISSSLQTHSGSAAMQDIGIRMEAFVAKNAMSTARVGVQAVAAAIDHHAMIEIYLGND